MRRMDFSKTEPPSEHSGGFSQARAWERDRAAEKWPVYFPFRFNILRVMVQKWSSLVCVCILLRGISVKVLENL